jgi:hypothetical protein
LKLAISLDLLFLFSGESSPALAGIKPRNYKEAMMRMSRKGKSQKELRKMGWPWEIPASESEARKLLYSIRSFQIECMLDALSCVWGGLKSQIIADEFNMSRSNAQRYITQYNKKHQDEQFDPGRVSAFTPEQQEQIKRIIEQLKITRPSEIKRKLRLPQKTNTLSKWISKHC